MKSKILDSRKSFKFCNLVFLKEKKLFMESENIFEFNITMRILQFEVNKKRVYFQIMKFKMYFFLYKIVYGDAGENMKV